MQKGGDRHADTAGIEKNEDSFLLMLCVPGGHVSMWQRERRASRSGLELTSWSETTVPQGVEGSEVQAGGCLL